MANTLRFKRGLVSGIPTAALGEPLFTTDTFDLYIGNGTGNTRFQKYIASGATTQILRGDGSLYTFPLAISSPSAGQVLKYNGTSWVNDSDAGITGSGSAGQVAYFTGATTQSGSNNLFWDATNSRLGIGTNTPNSLLNLYASDLPRLRFSSGSSGDAWIDTFGTAFRLVNNSASGALQFSSNGLIDIYTAGGSAINFSTSATQRARITSTGNFIINNASTDNGLRFQVTGDGYFSGSVGIARTPSASYKLHVAGDGAYEVTSGNVGFSLISGADSYSFYFNDADNSYRIYSSNGATDRLVLSSSGNLGLGVTPSAWASTYRALQVGVGTSLYNLSTSNGTFLGSNYFFNGTNNIYINTATATAYGQVSGQHQWFNAPSGTAGTAVSFTQAMTLDASGRLGIGTTSPDSKFHVLTSGPTNQLRINYNGTNDNYYDALNHYFRSGDGSFARLYIFSTGNVSIAGVSVGSDTGELLQVNGTMRVSGASTFNGKLLLSTTLNYGIEVYNNTSADSRLNLTNSTTGTGADKGTMVGAIGTTAYLYNYQNGNLILGTNGTDRLTISNTGAATFSSSVTAASGIFRTSSVPAIQLIRDLSVTSVGPAGQGIEFGALNGSTPTAGAAIYGRLDNPATTGALQFQTLTAGSLTTKLTIDSTGAATFSSSVTAGGNLLLTAGTASSIGAINLIRTGTSPVASRLTFGTDGTGYSFAIGKNQGGTVTDLLTILDSGATTFSSSVTALTGFFGGALGLANQRVANFKNTNGNGYIEIQGSGTAAAQILSTLNGDFYVATGGTAGTFGTTRLLIDNTGAATFSSTVTGASFIPTSSTAPSNGMYLAASNTLAFSTSTTEAMRITSSGSIGINSPTTNSERLVVRQTTNSVYSAGIYTSASTGTSFGLRVQAGTNSSDAAMQILSQAGSTYLFLRGDNNLGFGTSLVGATGTNTMSVFNGTAPSSNLTDTFQMYSNDIVAGNAAPHFRTENGAIIKLYQETTAVGNSTISVGGGNAVLDDTEFDGYTLRQIVRALRNQGILQ